MAFSQIGPIGNCWRYWQRTSPRAPWGSCAIQYRHVHLQSYNYHEPGGVYRALLATPTYANQPTRAVEATASQCRAGVATVYRAIAEMERVV